MAEFKLPDFNRLEDEKSERQKEFLLNFYVIGGNIFLGALSVLCFLFFDRNGAFLVGFILIPAIALIMFNKYYTYTSVNFMIFFFLFLLKDKGSEIILRIDYLFPIFLFGVGYYFFEFFANRVIKKRRINL